MLSKTNMNICYHRYAAHFKSQSYMARKKNVLFLIKNLYIMFVKTAYLTKAFQRLFLSKLYMNLNDILPIKIFVCRQFNQLNKYFLMLIFLYNYESGKKESLLGLENNSDVVIIFWPPWQKSCLHLVPT